MDRIPHLGGTAKSPEDVRRFHALGLVFAEIPVKDPDAFTGLIEQYREVGEELGMDYLCHGPLEGDPNNLEALERIYLPKVLAVIPRMKRLGMSLLTIHLWLDSRFVKKEGIRFKIDLLGKILEKAKEAGITLCLENLSENAEHLERPLAEHPDLFLTLDVGHGQILSEENTSYGIIRMYPERIRHIHIHDNRGGNSHLDDLHLPIGEGLIQFQQIFRELRLIPYTQTITLELTPPEIERCLVRVKAMLFQ